MMKNLKAKCEKLHAQNEAALAAIREGASQLGKLAKGKPKTLTKAERKRRKESLAMAREKRWPAKNGDIPANVPGQVSPLAFGMAPAREAEKAGDMTKVPKAWGLTAPAC